MGTITNPTALKLSEEVRKTVAPSEFVTETLSRKDELEQLREYMKRREHKLAEKVAQSAEQKGKAEGEAKGMEKMLIMALQGNAPPSVIETMQKGAGITEARLAELKEQARLP